MARNDAVRRRTFGAVLVAALFITSFAATTGATVALGDKSPVTADGGPGQTQESSSDTSRSDGESTVTQSDPASPTKVTLTKKVSVPKPAPKTATKKQVKSATATLCEANTSRLPTVEDVFANRKWTEVLEVLAADRGLAVGPVDGFFNDATAAGLSKLEKDLGQRSDGSFQTSDWAALAADACPAPEPVYVADSGSGASTYSGGGEGSSGGNSGGGGGTLVLIE